ncbi:hypothetical protein AC369_22525 [Salmonella enterica subsp. diarizonae]|nr:hypothetical protein [Salmonella enterica]EBF4785220.1 hypothetical protein [Salmonella enterica subsp. diarizonae]EBK6837882.1 hypothetical protein [Salmonella enterica]
MSRIYIWRAVAACSSIKRDEAHVFVDAPDYETAKKRVYERLWGEWGISWRLIDIYNLWNEAQLRDMSIGSPVPAGLPLLESGGGNGKVYYDREPLILVASARLREVLECALREVPA